ncbi:Shikimate dehydrogenase (NADP(+)) [bioreactor metagenome]|uniref:Shikimate dehydrogenase (NADP(+)) n=1 Tax=bioreactor metagenome TaxID=1076179 RepID=A0A645BFM4_9ZZZZ
MTLIGAGGAGSAIYTQAALDGVKEIAVFNIRDGFFDATARRLAEVADRTGMQLKLYDLADKTELAKQISDSALIADATKVGMPPLDNESNVAKQWLVAGQAVADTVYVPRVTKLLREAQEVGAIPISGLGMLLWQAAIAEQPWFGLEMPVPYIQDRFFGDH